MAIYHVGSRGLSTRGFCRPLQTDHQQPIEELPDALRRATDASCLATKSAGTQVMTFTSPQNREVYRHFTQPMLEVRASGDHNRTHAEHDIRAHEPAILCGHTMGHCNRRSLRAPTTLHKLHTRVDRPESHRRTSTLCKNKRCHEVREIR